MTMVNGEVKQYVSLNYILKPKSTGNFILTPSTAKADGKHFKSNSIKVQVLNAAPNNSAGNNFNSPFAGSNIFEDKVPETPFSDNILRKGESATEKVNRNMFVKLDLDKTSCFVGEPVIATYKLYTRLRSESNLIKNPSFNGFSVIDLQQPDNVSYRREKMNGKEYNVYVIRRAQLYPLQQGVLELEPAEIENNVYFIKEEYANRQKNLMNNIFREFAEASIPPEGIENHKINFKSKPAAVFVKALPDTNVPADFKGAVGDFTIKSILEKNNFTTDDAGKLKIIISGEGNLQLVNTPEILWPQNFEAFDPIISNDFVMTNVPVSGRKIIDFSFIISHPGTYILPSVKFSYFNPKQGKYKTDSTSSVSFTVTKGAGKKSMPIIMGNKNNTNLNNFFSNRRWVVSAVAMLILCGLILWLKKDKVKEETLIRKRFKAEEKVIAESMISDIIENKERNWMAKARVLLNDDSTLFYNELNFTLKGYLSKKLNLPLETINKKNIIEELDKKNIAVDTSVQLQQLLNEIELQLYTPYPQKEKMQELYDNTTYIIKLLDTYNN
jgi:hypothetical protein